LTSLSSEQERGSIKPVIDLIPLDLYENPTWKGLGYFTRDLVIYVAAVTALAVFANPWWDAALEILAVMSVTALFVVAHDCAHGALFNTKRKNAVVGRIAMLPSLHVFEAWVLGHNRIHHAFTVRQGYDFVWHPVTPAEYAATSRWGRLVHRVEWSWQGAGIYYFNEVWLKKMIIFQAPARWVQSIRRDRILTASFVVLTTTGLVSFGVHQHQSVAGIIWLVTRVLIIPFLGFCTMIGSVVHVHHVQPDIRWWKKGEWTKFKGQMEGTTVLRVPRGVNFFFHWIMIHSPHHVDMRIPMYNLEKAALAIEAGYPEVVHDAPLRFRDFQRNTAACKLYDFDAGTWLTYKQARQSLIASNA
jgi:omega-6 fatty acid desaturase (delta-12 desaturase)